MYLCISVCNIYTYNFFLQNRDWLKSLSLNNSQNLDHIESALFVFVMDDTSPANFEEVGCFTLPLEYDICHYSNMNVVGHVRLSFNTNY